MSPGASSRCLVTGCAGFVGSHLAERLLADGHAVTGVDCFTDYYARERKERNLAGLRTHRGFTLVEADLADADLPPLLEGVDRVFHEAGQPGVRASWGRTFDGYCRHNILGTQRLLEAARESSLRRFVYASSSSVYGDAPQLPARETTLPRPVSPYGVTKLAAEHLCGLYASNFGVPTVSLRYFTVYGPRQRPDMAFSRFVRALLDGDEIRLNGDGEQTRDFTFVSDIVAANVAASEAPLASFGRVYNVGGGSRVTVNHVIGLLEDIVGVRGRIRTLPQPPGDARHTWADCTPVRDELGFSPRYSLEEGLREQVAWARDDLRRSG